MVSLGLEALLVLLIVAGVLAPFCAWVERRQGARAQDRGGLSGAGIMDVTLGGSLQPVADFLKLLTKENTAPAASSRGLHLLAPLLAFACAVVAFAVIPFGSSYGFGETTVSLVLSDPDAGVLVLFVVGTVGALAPLLAGAGGGSARAAIGGLRAGAQMVSYRVVMAFALVPMLMIFGTLALGEMGAAQDEILDLAGIAARLGLREPLGLEALPSWVGRLGVPAWGVLLQPAAFVLVLVCGLAEAARPPFDLARSGSELAGGYASEYSGLRLGLFSLSDFVRVAALAALLVVVFLGGWSIPYLPQARIVAFLDPWLGVTVSTAACLVLHVATFFAKLAAVVWLLALLRWSYPRFRTDQLMGLCWKRLLPLALANVFLTAAVLLSLEVG